MASTSITPFSFSTAAKRRRPLLISPFSSLSTHALAVHIMPVSTDNATAVAVVPGQGARRAGGRNADLPKAPTVDSHTAALGIIQPPPDVRAIVDKTAQFVARNGE